jgi:hypothetical protein
MFIDKWMQTYSNVFHEARVLCVARKHILNRLLLRNIWKYIQVLSNEASRSLTVNAIWQTLRVTTCSVSARKYTQNWPLYKTDIKTIGISTGNCLQLSISSLNFQHEISWKKLVFLHVSHSLPMQTNFIQHTCRQLLEKFCGGGYICAEITELYRITPSGLA